MPIQPQRCAVILVNHNSAADTLGCLRALYALPDRPGLMVVVDNASQEADRRTLCEHWGAMCRSLGLPVPGAEPGEGGIRDGGVLMSVSANNGFGSGNNAALRLLLANTRPEDCHAFWILNNDTEPQPGALRALCDKLNSGYAVAGSTLVFAHDGETVQTAAGGGFSPATGATRFVLGGSALGTVQVADIASVERQLDYISGASLLCRRELCGEAGLFPEEYFLYYEDVDLGITMRRAGHKLGGARASVVLHGGGRSTGARQHVGAVVPLRVDKLVIRNRYYLLRKYFPLHVPIALAALAGVLLRRVLRRQGGRLIPLCLAAAEGLLGRTGKPE